MPGNKSTVSRVEIKAALAQQMVSECIDYARAHRWEICATICDPRGHLVALARTDHVVAPAIQYAIDKAWTAATLGTTTEERVLMFPGGFPIVSDGICIAGLGVSGAKDEEDVEIATSIIEKNGFSLQVSG